MKRDLKQRWVEALRSETYKQGTEFLRRADTYCCLGVLCDVMGMTWEKLDAIRYRPKENDGASSHIGFQIASSMGLPDSAQHTLWRMNDSGKPFSEIAEWIEANIPEEE